MKKAVSILVLILLVFILTYDFGKWPLKNLNSDDVVNVSLLADPPGKRIKIKDEIQIQELMDVLHSVVIYKEDDSGRDAEGQLIEFTLTMKDGNTVKVQPFGRFMLINDKCYKTKSEPCLELFTLGNRLLKYYAND